MMWKSFEDFHPDRSTVASHVGLIPDGNRRWALKSGVALSEAYLKGVQQVLMCLDFFFEHEAQAVSVYLASTANFTRSSEEVEAFCDAGHVLANEMIRFAEKIDARVLFAGRREVLAKPLERSIDKLVSWSNEGRRGRRIYLCLAYNPLEEVLAAARATPVGGVLLNHLWVPEPVDLVIRTGKANLLSNFLPLQAGYARLYFIDKLFNDLERDDLRGVYEHFGGLSRRYGE